MSRILLVIVCATGSFACSKLLGIDDLHPRDGGTVDASADAPPTDAPIDAAPCVPRTLSTTLLEDTMILATTANPAIRHGGDDTIDIGLSLTSRALLRFQLTSEIVAALAPSGTATKADLTLTIRTSGGLCGAGCTTGATSFQVFAANNYWNEGSPTASYYGAEWGNRFQTISSDGLAWSVAGADGATDRSMVSLGTGSVMAAATGAVQVTLPLTMLTRTEITSRLGSMHLSLILVPTSGGTLFLYSREGSVAMAANLAVTVCP